jgi:uncharacterized membrane protein YoaK (UPF0700 family)
MAQTDLSFAGARKPKVAVALLLTFASGIVDICGFLGVFHMFTAHLTGVTVHLGNSLSDHDWGQAFAAVVIVAAYAGGSLAGRLLMEIGARRKFPRVASITLTIEMALLACIAVPAVSDALGADPRYGPYIRIAFLAAAMGVQTATLTRIGPLTVHTTFVTGMINKTMQLVSHVLVATYDLAHVAAGGSSASASDVSGASASARRAALRAARKHEAQMALFLAVVWSFYVAGAAFGTWSFGLWGLRAIFTAIAILAVALAIDAVSPLSIEEEKEQSER